MKMSSGALRRTPRALFFVAPLLVLFITGGCARKSLIMTVNGAEITEKEFYERCASMVPQPTGGTVGVQVLVHLIRLKMVEAEAKKLNIMPSQEEVNQLFEFLRTQEEQHTGRTYDEILDAQGRTREQALRDVRESVLIHKFSFHEVSVDEQEMRRFFEQNREQFGLPPRVVLSLIRTQSKGEIDKLKLELDNRAPFETQAQRSENIDPSRDTQGHVPHEFTINDTTLERPVLEAAFKLNVGEYSKPIRSGASWVIVKVDQKKEAIEADFAKMRPALLMQLQRDRGQTQAMNASQRLMEMMRTADIKVHRQEYEPFVKRLLTMPMTGGPGGPGATGEAPGHEGHGH